MAEGLIPACLGLPGPKNGIFIPLRSLASCLPCGSRRQWQVPAAPPPKASHWPAAVGIQTPMERLQRRLGPPGRLPAGRGPVAPALRSR
jgi:hypothetical protein